MPLMSAKGNFRNLQPADPRRNSGNDRCTAEGITVVATAPVLGICRKLVEAGHDPATPLEAWRGDVLALRIRSIGEGARLQPASHGVGFELRPDCRSRRALPVAPIGSAGPRLGDDGTATGEAS